MAKTQAVNFRADSVFYQKTKDILADEKITVSDVLNAALRKIANRTVDAREFVSSDVQDTQVFLADRAKQDLREIHDYIVMNFYSQQSADGKVDLILTALETLEIFPEACPLVSSRGYGEMTDDGKPYRYMPIENYLAFYYIENHTVFVARILSAKQDWVKIFYK